MYLEGLPFSYGGMIRLCGCDRLGKAKRPHIDTRVARYVQAKGAKLEPRLRDVLARWAGKMAAALAAKYKPRTIAKAEEDERDDHGARADEIARLLAALEVEKMAEDLETQMSEAMRLAFNRAAIVGIQEVGMRGDESIVKQMDPLARNYAKRRGGELIKDLAGTTREDMRALIGRAIQEGMSVDRLRDAVEASGAFSPSRARTIARTELAFAHVQGNVAGWKATGEVEGYRVILGDNHEVEDICDEAVDKGVIDIDDDEWLPPLHPNCLLPDTTVAAAGVTAHFKRWFEGEVVDIWAGANHLAVTPNHPVLTSRGWISAGRLQVGDHVFECTDPQRFVGGQNPDDHHVPTRVDEMAHALLMAGGVATSRMPTTPEAFHGDAGAGDGEVDVVWSAREVMRWAERLDHLEDLGLAVGHRLGCSLRGKRNPLTNIVTLRNASDSRVRLDQPALSFIDSDPGSLDNVSVGHAADREAVTLEQVAQRGAVTVEALGEVYGRLASLVHPVEVVNVGKRWFAGHVFNLSTRDGWYFASSLITHNCVCDAEPVLRKGDDDADQSE